MPKQVRHDNSYFIAVTQVGFICPKKQKGENMHANIRNNEIIDFNSEYLNEDIIQIETTEDIYTAWLEDKNKVICQSGVIILNPDFESEQQAKKLEEFNKEFFNTSLGYIRRKVTMKDGTTKDFLTDIVPLLQVGIQIITYSLNDNEIVQNTGVAVTETFINECKQQLFADFYGG